jgi:hypothetical protein
MLKQGCRLAAVVRYGQRECRGRRCCSARLLDSVVWLTPGASSSRGECSRSPCSLSALSETLAPAGGKVSYCWQCRSRGHSWQAAGVRQRRLVAVFALAPEWVQRAISRYGARWRSVRMFLIDHDLSPTTPAELAPAGRHLGSKRSGAEVVVRELELSDHLFYMCPRNGMSGEDVDVRHLLGGCRTVAAFGAFRS